MKQVRVIGWDVRPVLMVDDGEHLTPLDVQPVTVLAVHWDQFKNGGDAKAITDIQAQVDTDPS